MAKLLFKHSESAYGKFRVFIQDTTSAVGAGLTGLTFSSSGLAINVIADNEASSTNYTAAGSTIETITTIGTFAAPTATKCRFKEIDSTNLPGLYEVQIADARWAVSDARAVQVRIAVTGGFCAPVEIQLALFDVNSATVTVGTNNDKTGYGLSSAAVQAIWDAATSALTAVGSIGKKLADWVVGTIDTYTGNTKQTGDAYARLGAPAGASVSADVAALAAYVDTEVAAIKAKTDSLTFTVANVLDANIQRVNDVVVNGTGALGDEWGP